MPKHPIISFLIAFALLISVVHCDGPYKGRVIDERSGKPIQGVVAVGSWSLTLPTAGGGGTKCLDAREAVTDDKGEFTIPTSAYGEFFGKMNIAIYKVGYQRFGLGPWRSLKEASSLKEIVKWDGDRAIFPLKRVPKHRLNTAEGRAPSVCGRKDGKPLSALNAEREKYRRTLKLQRKQ